MGMRRYFGTFLMEGLRPHGEAIGKVAGKWAKEQKLSVALDSVSPQLVRMHVRAREGGIFELQYTCRENGSHARVWMDFYDMTGTRTSPDAIPEMLKAYAIDTLWDQLKAALENGKIPS